MHSLKIGREGVGEGEREREKDDMLSACRHEQHMEEERQEALRLEKEQKRKQQRWAILIINGATPDR